MRTRSPTARPAAASVSAPSATSDGVAGALPSMTCGSIAPRNCPKPQAVTGRPAIATLPLQIEATAANTCWCTSRVLMGAQSLGGWVTAASPAVVSHVQPYATGVETR